MTGETADLSAGDAQRPELLFLGSSGTVQVPWFACGCSVCEEARRDPRQRRTRASVALLGQEAVLIDASPDIETQLAREGIRRVDRIFITHWHYDHVWGLAALHESASDFGWPPVHIYIPQEVLFHYDNELAFTRPTVVLHPIAPGDHFDLPDASWEVVKTTHRPHSVGFIVRSSSSFAYLVDGTVPPPATIERLPGLDHLILESSVDRLIPKEGQQWMCFSLEQAVDFWGTTGIARCILTHLSCHNYERGRLSAGLSDDERRRYAEQHPGLTFAYDGMRFRL